MRKFLSLLLMSVLACSALMLAACNDGGVTPSDGNLAFNAGFDNVVITKGESAFLQFTTDLKGQQKWESEDPDIASVTYGSVSGLKVGTTKIKLTIADKTIESTVRVNAEIRTDKTMDLLLFDASLTDLNDEYSKSTLDVRFAPAISDVSNFEFEVSDDSVITVTQRVVSGNVKLDVVALKKGKATITYKDKSKVDGQDRDAASTVVTVSEAQNEAKVTINVTLPNALEAHQGLYFAGNIEHWGGKFKDVKNTYTFTKSETNPLLYSLTLYISLTDDNPKEKPDDERSTGGTGTQADPLIFPGRTLLFKFVMIGLTDGAPAEFSWACEEIVDENRELFLLGGDVSADYTVSSFKKNAPVPAPPQTMNLTFNVVLPSALAAKYDLYLAGELAGLGSHWNTDIKFTRVDATHFTLVLNDLEYNENSNLTFKILIVETDKIGTDGFNIWQYEIGKHKSEGTDNYVIALSSVTNSTITIDSSSPDIKFGLPTA